MTDDRSPPTPSGFGVTSTALERAARESFRKHAQRGGLVVMWEQLPVSVQAEWMCRTADALRALREPDGAMLARMLRVITARKEGYQVEHVWQAAIDSILAEQPGDGS